MLELASEDDEYKTGLLLTAAQPLLGGVNCMELAHRVGDRQFISHVACQRVLNQVWMGVLDVKVGFFKVRHTTIATSTL